MGKPTSDDMHEQELLKKLMAEVNMEEGCPGCRNEKRKDSPGIPWKILIITGFMLLCSALPTTSLFPYLYFMIRDFHIAKQEEDVGFYAGFVGASFLIGRALTSICWGMLADRYGRKPVIIFGAIAVVILNTVFGLSVNFWMAIISRFLLGCLCGLPGPIKAYVSEVCREEHQAIAMSLITASWSIGVVIGPALGGLLAQPADKYPRIISKESLFGRFPYFLPCLVITIFAVVATIGAFWLPETLHTHKPNESCEDIETTNSETNDKSREKLYKNWALISSVIVYCIFSLHDMAYSEIFSLWVVSPRALGGLSFSTKDVGVVLSISGIGMMIFQIIVYPKIEKAMGPIMSARISAVLSIPLLQSYPFIALLSGFGLHFLLNFASMMKNCLSMCIVSSTLILQNSAVDQNQRGAANGISMTAMSLFNALGPSCGGALFSWSEKRHDASVLPGVHVVFTLLNVVVIVGVLLSFKPFLVEQKLRNTEADPSNVE